MTNLLSFLFILFSFSKMARGSLLVGLVCLLATCCVAISSSSPSGLLLWTDALTSSLSSASDISKLSLVDYSALILFKSENPAHQTSSSSLLV